MYLKEETNFFIATLDVLHIAPEPCFIHRFEKQHGNHYITADIESPLAKVKMDIHLIPFGENHFDVVFCNHVLEHVADDIQAMKEIKRVLKPGGWAILQVPFFSPVPEVTIEDSGVTDKREREKAFGQDDHVRLFGRDYLQRIQRSGLTGVANAFAKTLPDATAARCGVSRGEIIYLGIK